MKPFVTSPTFLSEVCQEFLEKQCTVPQIENSLDKFENKIATLYLNLSIVQTKEKAILKAIYKMQCQCLHENGYLVVDDYPNPGKYSVCVKCRRKEFIQLP